MTIDSKGFTTYGIDERIITNPGLALSREAVRTQKETLERVKAEILQPKEDEVKEAADKKSQVNAGSAGDETANDPGKDMEKDAQKYHVSIEA